MLRAPMSFCFNGFGVIGLFRLLGEKECSGIFPDLLSGSWAFIGRSGTVLGGD